jgi:hypothetical protein
MPYRSSLKAEDHLIQPYDGNNQEIIFTIGTLPRDDLDIRANDMCKETLRVVDTRLKDRSVEIPEYDSNTFTPIIPQDNLEKVCNLLKSSEEVKGLIRVGNVVFRGGVFVNSTTYRYIIDKNINNYCPVGKRVHSSNHSFFQYDYKSNTIRYGCFNGCCGDELKNHIIFLKIEGCNDNIVNMCLLNNTCSLHCHDDIIKWDEIYELGHMKEYKIRPLQCIKAGMGIGKTKIITSNYIPTHCSNPKTKCLFITYQQLLSNKFAVELNKYGFVNYLDVTDSHEIYDNKIVICLDSLLRVSTRNFEYIFIDEALSVLLHFNSQYIKRSSQLCSLFEFLLLQCSNIIILDAISDNTIVQDFVNYIGDLKNIKPYYIKNTYIRPSNRRAFITVNKDKSQEGTFKLSFFSKVRELLVAGKKIVVASSTKKLTEDLACDMTQYFNNTKKIMTYNSASNKETIKDHFVNIETTWNKFDLLIYSPTISAGISFEGDHYNEFLCYLDNSSYTPPVDVILQQMYRVRQLKSGTMSIYINDYLKLDKVIYPITVRDIDEMLHKDALSINRYTNLNFESQTNVDLEHGIIYDTQRLSYLLLRGIILNTNKSLTNFTKLLVNTLRKDYNIPCKYIEYNENKNNIQKALELQERLKALKVDNKIDYSDDLIIEEAEYEEINKKQKRNEDLSNIEKQKKWTYECINNIWKLPNNKVNIDFYNKYIMECIPKNIKRVFDLYFQSERLKDMINNDIGTNIGLMKNKLETIISSNEYNIELFKSKTKEYYKMLLEGQGLLEIMMNNKLNFKENLNDIIVNKDNYNDRIKEYISGLNEAEYSEVVSLFKFNKDYKDRKVVLKSDKRRSWFAKIILEKSFGIDIVKNEKTKNNKTGEDYGSKILKNDWISMFSEYGIKMSIDREYRILDIDDDNINLLY